MVETLEIVDGFQKTVVGVIPIDWVVVDFSAVIASTQLGGNYPNNELDNGVPLIKMGNLGRGKIVLNKLDFISSDTTPSEKDRLKFGDVIFNTRNTMELVGKVAVWRNELSKAYFNSNIMRFNFNTEIIESSFFMNYVLNSRKSITQLKGIATGTTSVAAIYSRDLFKIQIPLPSTKAEQTAIATALSDIDALIEAQEKLIAKKRNIKQGAMQELLKPKEGWNYQSVSSFTDATSGGTPNTSVEEYWGGNIRWMSSGEVHQKRVYEVEGRITELGLRSSSARLLPVNCVLIGLAGQGKTRGTIAINKVELCTNQSIGAILPNDKFRPEYLYYNLDARYDELRKLSTGDGGRGGLNLTLIRALKIPFPPHIQEQEKIIKVLRDIDTEIEQLETQLSKYKMLKTGMMQELLTGKKRLV